MRFHQLSIGQTFRFQGETYTKQDSLMSVHAGSGRRRLIKRSAEVELLDETPDPSPAAPTHDAFSAAAVSAAFETFHLQCRQLLAECSNDAQHRERLEARLEQARLAFLEQLQNSNA